MNSPLESYRFQNNIPGSSNRNYSTGKYFKITKKLSNVSTTSVQTSNTLVLLKNKASTSSVLTNQTEVINMMKKNSINSEFSLNDNININFSNLNNPNIKDETLKDIPFNRIKEDKFSYNPNDSINSLNPPNQINIRNLSIQLKLPNQNQLNLSPLNEQIFIISTNPENKQNDSPIKAISKRKLNRKLDRDCIQKKFKSKVLKCFRNKINRLLLDKKLRLKLKVVTKECNGNVPKQFNKNLLKFTMKDIFRKYSNLKEIYRSIKQEIRSDLYEKYLKMSFEEAIHCYLKSDDFEEDLSELTKKESNEYFKEYKRYSKEFIHFYQNYKES